MVSDYGAAPNKASGRFAVTVVGAPFPRVRPLYFAPVRLNLRVSLGLVFSRCVMTTRLEGHACMSF